MSDDNCKLCRFWRRWISESEVGSCRRFPPVVVASEDLASGPDDNARLMQSMNPATYDDDWCGEFQPKLAVRKTVPLTEHYRALNLGGRETDAIQNFFRNDKKDEEITVGDVASMGFIELLCLPRVGEITCRRIQLAVALATGIEMKNGS